ncbi:hypothetical protein Pogu_1563 [Pyrobaculum oguniense TE7]|uniref:Uncharacterized protein n=1 Tax=Pyrobaculum oguniense (strain DSM 13380 / JCM 10595 / TE7) TaxID=698757 RepID=H6Q961_PYROT|nr:hypothetical protein Pogu_1563 [Pyrobaculum oguniense TE7]
MPNSKLIGVAALLLAVAASALSLTDRWNDLAGGIMIEVGYYQTPDRYILVGYCSLGVPVYWYEGSGRVFGFLTAGHCTNQYYQDVVYQPYRSSQVNNYIGTVLRDSYYSGQPSVDAALIRYRSLRQIGQALDSHISGGVLPKRASKLVLHAVNRSDVRLLKARIPLWL